MLLQVVTVSSTWPFYSWGLVSGVEPTEKTFYEVRLAGPEGEEIRYDARAANPLGGTIVRRYGKNMVSEYTQEETLTIGNYLLRNARDYREDLNEGGEYIDLSVPRHQRDYKWETEKLEAVGEFQQIRVYWIKVQMSEDGTKILNRREKLRLSVNETEVVIYDR
jgi:hypothetical protein